MGVPPVSVVIVSRGRPQALRLCLTAVAQLDHPGFEVIVVACPEGAAAVASRPDADRIKLVPFDTPNISVARNLGIAHAAGEVVAFLDDDAVPEPTWLGHLCAPFAAAEIAAAGGYVRGRNGIDYQWTARRVNGRAEETPLSLGSMEAQVFAPKPGQTVKLQGTNMAHRRSVLAGLGGFDPAYRFFLDDTDLDLRLAAAGHTVAVVPRAQVQHGYAESARRGADRTPRDLTEIGASLAVFLRRHCPEAERGAAWLTFRASQRRRLLEYMRLGPLGPDDVVRLLAGLDRGYRDGEARPLSSPEPIGPAKTPFLPVPGRPGAPRDVLVGRLWRRRKMRAEAARLAGLGHVVSVFRFSHTALYHQMSFRPEGYWEQTGGLWGRSIRSGRIIRPCLFKSRVHAEVERVAEIRGSSQKESDLLLQPQN